MSPKPPEERAYSDTFRVELQAIRGTMELLALQMTSLSEQLKVFTANCREDMGTSWDRICKVEEKLALLEGGKANAYLVYGLIGAIGLAIGVIMGRGGIH
jgi:hypothetical protein